MGALKAKATTRPADDVSRLIPSRGALWRPAKVKPLWRADDACARPVIARLRELLKAANRAQPCAEIDFTFYPLEDVKAAIASVRLRLARGEPFIGRDGRPSDPAWALWAYTLKRIPLEEGASAPDAVIDARCDQLQGRPR